MLSWRTLMTIYYYFQWNNVSLHVLLDIFDGPMSSPGRFRTARGHLAPDSLVLFAIHLLLCNAPSGNAAVRMWRFIVCFGTDRLSARSNGEGTRYLILCVEQAPWNIICSWWKVIPRPIRILRARPLWNYTTWKWLARLERPELLHWG